MNVGVLAFAASVTAFYISHYKLEKQQERDFIAARAFLPSALNDLCKYTESSATLLNDALEKATNGQIKFKLRVELPNLPTTHRETFGKCISLAEPELSSHLAEILEKLQTHHARMENINTHFHELSTNFLEPSSIETDLLALIELRALINITFDAARGKSDFRQRYLTEENRIAARQVLRIKPTKNKSK